jgi:hypothetical protein
MNYLRYILVDPWEIPLWARISSPNPHLVKRGNDKRHLTNHHKQVDAQPPMGSKIGWDQIHREMAKSPSAGYSGLVTIVQPMRRIQRHLITTPTIWQKMNLASNHWSGHRGVRGNRWHHLNCGGSLCTPQPNNKLTPTPHLSSKRQKRDRW